MTVAALSVYNCTYIPPTSSRNQLDGDTFRCQGYVEPIIPDSVTWVPKVRLIKVNAPETGQPLAANARTQLINWLTKGPFNLICFARDKYGRLLADAEHGDGLLSDYMLTVQGVVPMTLEAAQTLLPNGNPAIVQSLVHPSQLIKPEVTP